MHLKVKTLHPAFSWSLMVTWRRKNAPCSAWSSDLPPPGLPLPWCRSCWCSLQTLVSPAGARTLLRANDQHHQLLLVELEHHLQKMALEVCSQLESVSSLNLDHYLHALVPLFIPDLFNMFTLGPQAKWLDEEEKHPFGCLSGTVATLGDFEVSETGWMM